VATLEDGAWKALVPLLLSFTPEIAQSELLARRLANLSARRLSTLFSDMDGPNYQSPLGIQPPAALLEHLQCPAHRSTVLALVSALQVITLECPTALVYNGNNFLNPSIGLGGNGLAEATNGNLPIGSALDLLPIPPSALPMPPRANNPIIRSQLRFSEDQIRMRSRAAEAKWACDEWQQSSAATTLQKVLSGLDALDTYSFDKFETGNSLDTLYSKIFASTPANKENPGEGDAPIVLLLCQWAVAPQRYGDHRALIVARLLEHRQAEVTSTSDSHESMNSVGHLQQGNSDKNENSGDDVANGNDTNSGSESGNMGTPQNVTPSEMNGGSNSCSGNGDDENDGYNGPPIYHNLLFNYLDSDAPVLGKNYT